MSCEYIESQILDLRPNYEVPTDTEPKRSPQISPDYNNLQITPKLQAHHQPALKNRIVQIELMKNGNKSFSPWNCSENSEDISSVLDKMKSLEFKTAMGLNY